MSASADVRFEVEVFHDGDCPLCAREIALLRRLDRRGRIRFTDIAAPGFDAASVGVPHATLMERIHGRLPDGSLVEGVEVFRRLYAAVGFSRLVALTRVPGIAHLLDAVYRAFATNRLRLTGRCAGGACAVGQRKERPTRSLALALLLALPSAPLADVRPFADFEAGWAMPGYNDVRIPGDSGTRFSLNDDGVALSSAPYARLKLGATFAGRHTVFVTGAPLRLQARGTLPKDVLFDGGAYPAGTFVTGQYRFDTWRLTYRYTFWSSPRLEATVGVTGLVRDAGISLHGGGVFREKLNTGVVPLLSFSVLWRFAGPWSVLLDGDALAGGPGRAEDVTLALRRQLRDDVAVRVGYRVVEGGADVAEVYNFALVGFVAAGLEIAF